MGTLKYVPGQSLPRHDKQLLERTIANGRLANLAQREAVAFADLQNNPADPPDVVFTYAGQARGMELVELVPPNRLEKDAIIRQLRRQIVSRLDLGTQTKDCVINVFRRDDYAQQLKPGRVDKVLATTLNEFFAQPEQPAHNIPVPDEVRPVVTGISYFKEDLSGDPRIDHENEPLIIFGAQCTLLVPEDDCPKMVAWSLGRKQLHDVDKPTWLAVWSNHLALGSLRREIDDAIDAYLAEHPVKYERVFHLHLFCEGGVTEFPVKREDGV